MKHLSGISRLPIKAQTEGEGDGIAICTDISNDYQAQLCFVVELLTSFFLPLFNIKNNGNPNE